MTRVLVAPQELKGTLRADEAAEAMRRALARARPEWSVEALPLADGGPGTVDAVLRGVPGARARTARVVDPLGRVVEATWALLPAGVAVIEMAAASGLWRVAPTERRVREATTYGTGQLIHAAMDAGCTRIVVGAGGSATNDAGVGALAALAGEPPPAPGERWGAEPDVARGEPAARRPSPGAARRPLPAVAGRGKRPRIEVWTDVTNPLLGPTGATRVYGPQKGASPGDVEALEAFVARVEAHYRALTGRACADLPGAGAAGGLAWALACAYGATLRPGFRALAELVGLDAFLERCDVALTAEGRLDAQTTYEKGPWALAALARAKGKRAVAFVGRCECPKQTWNQRLDDVVELGGDVPGTKAEAARRLEDAVRRWAAA